MPLLALIVTGLITIVVWLIVGSFILEATWKKSKERIVAFTILFVLTAAVWLILAWYFSSTASGKRLWKSQESNLNNGIQRKVEVYSVDGKLIKEYTGKFDIEYDDDRILFDDENGDRHVIYYPTGTVIIDEVD